MSKKMLEALINPKLLKWAREQAGFEIDEIAEKLKMPLSRIENFENGDQKPTIPQLRHLSNIYKRTLAVFFLPNIPKAASLPEDYRTLPGEENIPLSPKSLRLIRRAKQLRKIGSELAIDLEIKSSILKEKYSLNDPELLASEMRKKFNIDINEQFRWRDSYEAFSHWRKVIEDQGILVFQLSLPVNEVRGCTLFGEGFPAIVISSKDWINARIFTLFHEYAHIIINREGMCLPAYRSNIREENNEAGEMFCNHFSGAFLVPKNELFEIATPPFDVEKIKSIARRFKVSKYVLVRRLQIMNLISLNEYRKYFEEMLRQESKKPVSLGGPSVERKCIAEKGYNYISLVFKAENKGIISFGDMASYLGVKTKYIENIAMYSSRL